MHGQLNWLTHVYQRNLKLAQNDFLTRSENLDGETEMPSFHFGSKAFLVHLFIYFPYFFLNSSAA